MFVKCLPVLLLLLLTTLSLPAPARAQGTDPMVTVTADFYEGRIVWREALGEIIFRMGVLPLNGVLHACLAVTNSNARLKRHNRTVLRRAGVYVDGQRRLRGVAFAPIYPVGTDLVGQQARCKPLAGTFTASSSIEFKLSKGGVRD